MKLTELKKLATRHNIKGRSSMNKAELERALARVKKSRKPAKKKSRKPAKKKSRKPAKKKSRKPAKKKSRKPAKKKFIIMCDYTDKSLVLVGSTYAHKEEIKKAGGKYNPNLSVGKGWIFPKTKKKVVEKLVKKMRSAPAKSRKAVKKSRKKKGKKSSRKSSRKHKKKFRMEKIQIPPKGNCFQDCQGGYCMLPGMQTRYHNIYYTGVDTARFCSPGGRVSSDKFDVGPEGDQGQIVENPDYTKCVNPSKKYVSGHVCHGLTYQPLRNWNKRARKRAHARRKRTIERDQKTSLQNSIKAVDRLLRDVAVEYSSEDEDIFSLNEGFLEEVQNKAYNFPGIQEHYDKYFDTIMRAEPYRDLKVAFMKKVLEIAKKSSPANSKETAKTMIRLFRKQVEEKKEEKHELEKELRRL